MAIQVFHGDRGGVGKSMLAAAFGEFVLAKGLPFTVVETDSRNGDVGRYFEGAAPVRQIDLRVSDGWIELLSYLDEEQGSDILLALPAGIGGMFQANAGDLIAATADLKRTLTVWWAMNRTPDSTSLLQPVLKAFDKASGTQVVAVRNLYFGENSKFSRWNDSKTRQKFVASGGVEMDFPELHDRIVDATFGSLPARRFSANGESGLRYGERLVLSRWLDTTREHFEAIADKVGVGKR